jgi:hypothetical protein
MRCTSFEHRRLKTSTKEWLEVLRGAKLPPQDSNQQPVPIWAVTLGHWIIAQPFARASIDFAPELGTADEQIKVIKSMFVHPSLH